MPNTSDLFSHLNYFLKELDLKGHGLLWLDENLNVQGHNQAYRQLLNIDGGEQEFVGKPFQKLLEYLNHRSEFGKGDPNGYLSRHMESLSKNISFKTERVRTNGLVLSVSVTPLLSGGYVYVYQDISKEQRLRESLRRQTKASIIAIANLAEHRDPDTGIHVLRVARLVGQTARKLMSHSEFAATIDESFIERLAIASILHDVGKISTPDYILLKTGPLTVEERSIVQQHTITGEQLLKHAKLTMAENDYLDLSSEIALTHHECFDGGGYPHGLSGTDIPLSGRICAVADVFDALTSSRPYKAPWSIEDSLKLLCDQSSSQFDPLVVNAFIEVINERERVCLVQWAPTMSVGNLHIDDQHRMLIDIINHLARAEDSHNQHAVSMIIDELMSYAAFHFNFEENLMAEVSYPYLEEHKGIHNMFVQRVDEFREEIFIYKNQHLIQPVLEFLKNWLLKHIMDEDQRYSAFIRC